MNNQQSGPSPEGVMHGPYPDKVPQSFHHYDAINSALYSREISGQQHADLFGNAMKLQSVESEERKAIEAAKEEQPVDENKTRSKYGRNATLSVFEQDNDEVDEDPLAGDVDRYVSMEETRSDEQIDYDESVASRAHMSGDDGADDYWDDYDELHGTVDGGQPIDSQK